MLTQTNSNSKNNFEFIFSFNDKVLNLNDGIIEERIEFALSRNDYSFESGVLGLSWIISFLMQNEGLSEDPDEILYDLDDLIYKLSLKEIIQNNIDVKNHLYLITYYQQRVLNKSKSGIYRRFTHFEVLKLLIGRLNEFLNENIIDNLGNVKSSIDILLKYSYLAKYVIDESLFEECFFNSIEKILEMFVNNSLLLDEECLGKLYLCTRQYDNEYWYNNLLEFILINESKTYCFWSEISKEFITKSSEEINLIEFVKCDSDYQHFFEFISNIKIDLR